MFKKIKNLVSNQADKIIRDPVHASRVVVSSVLILGIFSLTLNLGAQIAPELLGASIQNDPPSIASKKITAEYQSAADKAILELVDRCIASRGGETSDWKKFMNNFEKSLSGILPGAGNLILNNPGIVSDRKEQFKIQVLQKYANLKFCIPEKSFNDLYQENYKKLSQTLSPFFQVRIHEDDTENEYPLNEIHPVFISSFANELYYAEQDLNKIDARVTSIIDRAINSAIELDQATNKEVNLLTQATANRLSETTNYALKKIGEINAEDSNIGGAISGVLADIRKILAIDETIPKPVMNGGSFTRLDFSAELQKRIGEALGHDPIYASNVILDQLGLPLAGPPILDEVNRLISSEEVSYGLLNLFRIEDRPAISEYLGVGMVRYAGSKLRLDPFTFGAENYMKIAENIFGQEINDPPEDQICYPLDPAQKDEKCFDFEAQESLTTSA